MSNVCQNVLHVFALVALHALHARRVQSALLPQRVRRARLTQLARRVKRVSLVRQRHRQPTPMYDKLDNNLKSDHMLRRIRL